MVVVAAVVFRQLANTLLGQQNTIQALTTNNQSLQNTIDRLQNKLHLYETGAISAGDARSRSGTPARNNVANGHE